MIWWMFSSVSIPIKERLNRRLSTTSLVSILSGMRVSFFLSSSVNLDGSVDISSRWQLRDLSLTWPHYRTKKVSINVTGEEAPVVGLPIHWSILSNLSISGLKKQQIESVVTPSGNSGHVVVPKAWIGKEAIVRLKVREKGRKRPGLELISY